MPRIAHVVHRMVKAGAHRYFLNLCRNGFGHLIIVTHKDENESDPEAIAWFTRAGADVYFVKDSLPSALQQKMNSLGITILMSHTRSADLFVFDYLTRLKGYGIQYWTIMLQGSWLEAKAEGTGHFRSEFKDVMRAADWIFDPSAAQHEPLLREAQIPESKVWQVSYAVDRSCVKLGLKLRPQP